MCVCRETTLPVRVLEDENSGVESGSDGGRSPQYFGVGRFRDSVLRSRDEGRVGTGKSPRDPVCTRSKLPSVEGSRRYL